MRLALPRLVVSLLLVLLGAGTLPASNQQVARALSSEGIELRSIIDHEFTDLDGDGVNEALVHGRGNLRGASLSRALGITFHAPLVDSFGHTILQPSPLAWGRFVGIFRFERKSFRWVPVLVGTYRREKGWVSALGVVEVAGVRMVQVSFEEAGRVQDRLFLLTDHGVREVFSSRRGTWMGEQFLVKGAKVLLTQGIPNPFAPEGRPGFLVRSRYRWLGDRFRPEYWKLWGQSFRPDWTLELLEEGQGPAFRKLLQLQRQADGEPSSPRLDLASLATRLYEGSSTRVVYQRGAYGVVVSRVNREDHPHYFVRPLLDHLGEARAVWVGLEELGIAPGSDG